MATIELVTYTPQSIGLLLTYKDVLDHPIIHYVITKCTVNRLHTQDSPWTLHCKYIIMTHISVDMIFILMYITYAYQHQLITIWNLKHKNLTNTLLLIQFCYQLSLGFFGFYIFLNFTFHKHAFKKHLIHHKMYWSTYD